MSEALRGWRAWHVVERKDGLTLLSWAHATAWPALRALEARCNRHGRPAKEHSCGLYAFDALEDALAYAQPHRPGLFRERALGVVVGAVSGWGRVIHHTRGWRSQFAYPYDLYLTSGDRALARAIADRYAVETSPFPP